MFGQCLKNLSNVFKNLFKCMFGQCLINWATCALHIEHHTCVHHKIFDDEVDNADDDVDDENDFDDDPYPSVNFEGGMSGMINTRSVT